MASSRVCMLVLLKALVCFCLPLQLCLGQTFRFQNITQEQGLSENVVNAVLQDRHGFVWIGTQDGLNRYDGLRFTEYKHDPRDPASISDNHISALSIDPDGILWVGTDGGGLNRFDPKTKSFQVFRYEDRVPTSLVHDEIRAVLAEPDGTIWVGTARGLSRRGPSGFTNYLHDGTPTAIRDNRIYSLLRDKEGKLWIGTHLGLDRFDEANNRFEHIRRSEDTSTIGSPVRALYQDRSGVLWVGDEDGLFRYDPSTDHLIQSDHTTRLVNSVVRSVFQDQSDTLWVGTDAGLHALQTANAFQVYLHESWNTASLSDNQVNTLFQDRTGLLWIGTQNGLSLFNRQTADFAWYRHQPGNPHSLIGKMIWAVYEDNSKNLWVGTDTGLSHYRGPKKVRDYQTDPSNPEALSHNSVRDIYEDSQKRFWIATRGGGLNLMDRSRGSFRHFRNDPNDPKSLSHDYAWVVYEDGNRVVWIGTAGGGLNRLRSDGISFDRFTHQNDDPTSLSNDLVSSLLQDSEGYLWVGTLGGGLNCYVPEKNQFTAYNQDDGLSHNRVISLYEDSAGTLWLGTWGGLNRLDKRTLRFHAYRGKDGLPSEVVYGIVPDSAGAMWMSTNKGLCKFDPLTEKIRVYTVNNGIQADEFNSGAYFGGPTGTLFFGGVNGLTVFKPENLSDDPFGPQMAFTELLLDNQPVEIKRLDPKSPLEHPLSETDTLTLTYHQNLVTIGFAALHFASPQKNRYAYQLEGFSNSWINAPADKAFATFTRLPHGKYSLRVKGSNPDGIWSESLAQLDLVILPPPWLTPTAKLLYALGVLLTGTLIAVIVRRRRAFEREVRKTIQQSEERLKFALWGSGDEHWDWDLTTATIYRSNQSNQLDFPQDRRQSDIYDLRTCVHEKDFERLRLAWLDHLEGRTPYFEATYRIRGTRQEWVWILDRGKIVERDAKGHPTRVSGTIKDISHLKETEDKLRLIAIAFENTSDGVFITDSELRILAVNQAYSRITGREPTEVLGRRFYFSSETNPDEHFSETVMTNLRETGHWQGEVQELRKNREIYTQELIIDLVRDIEGDTSHYIGVFSDITFRKKAEQELRHLANYDVLTNLPNRTLFGVHLQQSIMEADRSQKKFALLFIDLDNFKNINDSLGHSIGDLLLIEMGKRLVKCARENDVVARFGGDEFSILLKEIRLVHGAAKVAKKIIASLAEPFFLDGHDIVISPSIGIVLYPSDGDRPDALLRNADTAMYHAKSKGKNNYQFFTEEMNQRVLQRLQMEADLRTAIDSHELFLYYQPKVSFETGEIVGMEALARWRSPKHGFVSPAQFIPLAEETGLVVAMGKQVLEMACRETKRWVDMGLFQGRVAVNLSALQFRQKDLLKFVDNTLAEVGLSPKHLELEITEGTVMDNADHAIDMMHQFRERNLNLAIDDFGTGFSSLSYLKQFPINSLKVDRSFVVDMATSEDDRIIVASIIGLAHNLGMRVVAEGVENYEQVEALRALGCEEMQGFLFSRPIPGGEFEDLLRRRPNLYSSNAGRTPRPKQQPPGENPGDAVPTLLAQKTS